MTVQTSRPSSDIDSVWTCSSGAARWSLIDEAVVDDTDFIRSSYSTNHSQTVAIQSLTDPIVHSGHILHVRARLDRSPPTGVHAGRLVIYIMQGATQICSSTNTFPDTSTWQNLTYTLAVGEAGAITDYTDLRIKVESENCGDLYSVFVSQAYLEAPSVAISYPTDPLMRVDGIVRTFWAGKTYTAELTLGGEMADYISPVDNREPSPMIPDGKSQDQVTNGWTIQGTSPIHFSNNVEPLASWGTTMKGYVIWLLNTPFDVRVAMFGHPMNQSEENYAEWLRRVA